MNVVGYIRVSTQGQAKDGYSLKYQEEEIQAYCEKHGWNLIHISSYKKFFAEVDGKTALAFWKRYPSPSYLEGVRIDELTAFL